MVEQLDAKRRVPLRMSLSLGKDSEAALVLAPSQKYFNSPGYLRCDTASIFFRRLKGRMSVQASSM